MLRPYLTPAADLAFCAFAAAHALQVMCADQAGADWYESALMNEWFDQVHAAMRANAVAVYLGAHA